MKEFHLKPTRGRTHLHFSHFNSLWNHWDIVGPKGQAIKFLSHRQEK